MGDVKNHIMTCPKCGDRRRVFGFQARAVEAGKSTGTCRPCHNAAKAAKAKEVERPKVLVPCTVCGAARMLTQWHGKRLLRLGNNRCEACRLLEDATATARKSKVCRHCRKGTVNRPLGLCWGCYYAPGVRALYPSTSKYAKRGIANFSGDARMPEPTTAPPGTPDKVAVMETRAKQGQAIFHPADARYEGDPRPVEFLKARECAA